MADGILDGISNAVSGAGDFFLNRGRYADPNAMNAQFGVPEQDVRQAGINTLANVSSLLLAAGQPMTGAQRAQLLAGIGPALGGMQTDIFKSTQARLMNAQQREKMTEMQELQALDAERKKDPEGLAKKMNLPVGLMGTIGVRDLRDIAKQITIKRFTQDPSSLALSEAAAGVPQIGAPLAQVAQPVAAPSAPPSDIGQIPPSGIAPAGGSAPQAAAPAATSMIGQIPGELLQDISPEARRTLQVYQRALNDPRVQSKPDQVKIILENIDRLVPGLKEFSSSRGKKMGEQMASAPQALEQASYMTNLLDQIATHPGREYGTGASAWMSNIPGGWSGGARDFAGRANQVAGQTFLQAYESLKGTGQITQIEGEKAEQAISRLRDRYVTEEEYLQAIKDLRDVTESGRAKISKKLGVEYKPVTPPDVYKQLEKKPSAPAGGQLRVDPAAISDAKRAIASGAPANAVRQRLRERGLSDEGL
tara:strand:- start:2890 stop:4323 length:1434 start_codon:yes stop_codon:yes gene_type:complete